MPFELRERRRLGDFISLYAALYALSFREAFLALRRICEECEALEFSPTPASRSKEEEREKRRIVASALFGNPGKESRNRSALSLRKSVEAYLGGYLAAHPEERTGMQRKHPEFFSKAAFARLLREWSASPEEGEFFRIEQKSRVKNTRFTLQNVTTGS